MLFLEEADVSLDDIIICEIVFRDNNIKEFKPIFKLDNNMKASDCDCCKNKMSLLYTCICRKVYYI